MLTIYLSPMQTEDGFQHTVSYSAPVITLDGIAYDLSELPDGAVAGHPILGKVERHGNDYKIIIKLHHARNAPNETIFPEPIEVTVDGPVELPLYNTPEEVTDELA